MFTTGKENLAGGMQIHKAYPATFIRKRDG
jgi:hypothetical protein